MGDRVYRWGLLVHVPGRPHRQQRQGVRIMSTTTTRSATSASKSLTSSAAFKTFAIVFGVATAALYVICDMLNWPLFTYHPATNQVDLFYAPPRRGEGPAMYWYGWTITSILGAAVLGV